MLAELEEAFDDLFGAASQYAEGWACYEDDVNLIWRDLWYAHAIRCNELNISKPWNPADKEALVNEHFPQDEMRRRSNGGNKNHQSNSRV